MKEKSCKETSKPHSFKRVKLSSPGIHFFELENLEREAKKHHDKWKSDPAYAMKKVEHINESEIKYAKRHAADGTLSIYRDSIFQVEFTRTSSLLFATVFLHDGTGIYSFSRAVPSMTAVLNEIVSIEHSHDVPKTLDDVKKRKPAELHSIVDAFDESDRKLAGRTGYYG